MDLVGRGYMLITSEGERVKNEHTVTSESLVMTKKLISFPTWSVFLWESKLLRGKWLCLYDYEE